MKTVVCRLVSVSPYSQSKYIASVRESKEQADEFEARTWRERCHVMPDGHVCIPPMQFKTALQAAAQYLSLKIPGRRNATYTKHFEAGVMVVDPVVLPETVTNVQGEWLYLNADGKRGSGTRVRRCMPVIPSWQGDVTFHVLDDTITEEVFERHLREAGNFIGIGRWRPRQGGMYGRFRVERITWS